MNVNPPTYIAWSYTTLFKSMTFKSKWMMLHNFVVPIWNSKPLEAARWQQANNLICFLVSLRLSLVWKPAIYQLAAFKMRAPKRMCSLFPPLRKVTPIQESLEAEHSGPLRIMSGMTDEWRISWVKNREADLRSRSCNQKKKALMTSPTRECNLYHPIVTKSSCKTGLHARCHLPAWSRCAGILVEVVVRAARINRWQGGAKPDPRNSLPAQPRVGSCWYYCWPADRQPSLKACYCQWCYADLILSREVRWSCSLNLCKAPSDDLLGLMRTYYRPWKKLSIENL